VGCRFWSTCVSKGVKINCERRGMYMLEGRLGMVEFFMLPLHGWGRGSGVCELFRLQLAIKSLGGAQLVVPCSGNAVPEGDEE
jgi:hypothetical protein